MVKGATAGGGELHEIEEGVRYMAFREAVGISTHTGRAVTLPPEPTMKEWGQPII